jgi:hypothetical protein
MLMMDFGTVIEGVYIDFLEAPLRLYIIDRYHCAPGIVDRGHVDVSNYQVSSGSFTLPFTNPTLDACSCRLTSLSHRSQPCS